VAYSNRLVDIYVQVGQCLHLGAVLGAAALLSIAFPSVGFSVVYGQVREPGSSSLVVNELRLGRLRQLREKVLRYIRIDLLPETVAVGNVSANEQPGKPVVRRVRYDSNSCHSGLSSHCRGCSRVLKDPGRDPDRIVRRR
jgi:hypothetical protein